LENLYKSTTGKSEEKRSVGIPRRKSEGNVETDGEILVYGSTWGITFFLHPPIIGSFLKHNSKPNIIFAFLKNK
jgi:hypothetical protein